MAGGWFPPILPLSWHSLVKICSSKFPKQCESKENTYREERLGSEILDSYVNICKA